MIIKNYNPLNKIGILESILVYINKQINRKKRKLFLGIKCQIIKARKGKKMMKLENYYLATIIVIIPSGKKHQWILKLLGENEE